LIEDKASAEDQKAKSKISGLSGSVVYNQTGKTILCQDLNC
jgi:hypothetical protein